MSALVLLNLLNGLGKRDKMRGLPSILSLFRNEFNKFNNTRALMLDSIYYMTNTLKSRFWRKNVIILSLCTQHCYGRHNVSPLIYKPLVIYRFYCMALFHSQTRRHMVMINILIDYKVLLICKPHFVVTYSKESLIQEGVLSVTSESMCTMYWLTA